MHAPRVRARLLQIAVQTVAVVAARGGRDLRPQGTREGELIGSRLGVAITSFVNTFNPEVVVIGGGVMAAGELLLEPIRKTVATRALPPSRDTVRIVMAEFGVEAGMIGAAALAFDGLGMRAGKRY